MEERPYEIGMGDMGLQIYHDISDISIAITISMTIIQGILFL